MEDLKRLKHENAVLRASLNRISELRQNGEHLDSEWIKNTIEGAARDIAVTALLNKISRLEKQLEENK